VPTAVITAAWTAADHRQDATADPDSPREELEHDATAATLPGLDARELTWPGHDAPASLREGA
jgi:hypothetical protein